MGKVTNVNSVTHSLISNTPGVLTAAPVALPSAEPTNVTDKVEREAQLAIEVRNVDAAAARVQLLVSAHDGSITKDQRSGGERSSAEILVRVPSAQFGAFVEALSTIGEIRSRSTRTLDVSAEHKDLTILVTNLEAALARYRELLQKATDPMQILAVEHELERVRSDLDRIKGRLAFVQDRVAQSTVAIALRSPEPPSDISPDHKPVVALGLRGLSLMDIRESGTLGYFGGGLTIRLPRYAPGRGLVLDVDMMRACCRSEPARTPLAYDILVGFDLYSDSRHTARPQWFNPYLGFRTGFAQLQNRGDFAAAGVFGIEIFRTSALMIDAQVRTIALVGNPDGPHAAIQPSVGFDLGF